MKQNYRFRKLVHVAQVSRHLRPPLWPWDMDPSCSLLEKDPGVQNQCLRKLLCISYFDHKTIDCLQSKIHFIVGPKEPSLATGKRQNVAWFGYVIRHAGLFKTILQGTLDGDGCRAHARTAHNGILQRRLEEDLYLIVCQSSWWSNRSRDWTELTWPEHILIRPKHYLYTWSELKSTFIYIVHQCITVRTEYTRSVLR